MKNKIIDKLKKKLISTKYFKSLLFLKYYMKKDKQKYPSHVYSYSHNLKENIYVLYIYEEEK